MTKKQTRNFSAEEKTKIVLELLKEEVTISQLSSKYEVSSNSISYWKKQFLSNAAIAFEPAKVVSEYQEQIKELKEQNDELAKSL
jgi:putative transposase